MSRPPAYHEATLAYYAEHARAYAAESPATPDPRLDTFLDRLPRGGRILELGCGGGRDAAAMLARGFDVDVTDGSPAMAAEAGARLGYPVRVMRFDELDADAAYDAVWAQASLLHVPKAALAGVLHRVFRALKPGGLHFASFRGGMLEGHDALGRYFNYSSPETIRDAYRSAAPWASIYVETGEGPERSGAIVPKVAVTALKK